MSEEEDALNEKEALKCGLALLNAKWTGESDFDKSMRLLQSRWKAQKRFIKLASKQMRKAAQ